MDSLFLAISYSYTTLEREAFSSLNPKAITIFSESLLFTITALKDSMAGSLTPSGFNNFHYLV